MSLYSLKITTNRLTLQNKAMTKSVFTNLLMRQRRLTFMAELTALTLDVILFELEQKLMATF